MICNPACSNSPPTVGAMKPSMLTRSSAVSLLQFSMTVKRLREAAELARPGGRVFGEELIAEEAGDATLVGAL